MYNYVRFFGKNHITYRYADNSSWRRPGDEEEEDKGKVSSHRVWPSETSWIHTHTDTVRGTLIEKVFVSCVVYDNLWSYF